jgi:enoyl-CoA hydratase
MNAVPALVSYRTGGSSSTITMDDGKVNVLSLAMQAELGAALDQSQADGVPVVVTGRAGVFSAGFDLKTLRGGGADAAAMLRGGFELALRLLEFPLPVVAACSGHALAMASFLLLSVDYRIGAAGEYRIGPNEVAIGLVMPMTAVEICRARLDPVHFDRAVNSAEIFDPAGACRAGFLDQVVDESELIAAASTKATALGTLDLAAHAATKMRSRAASLAAIRRGYEEDEAFFSAMG